MHRVVLILGSEIDRSFAEIITVALDGYGIAHETHVASAHKQPKKVLALLEEDAKRGKIIYITIAGRSNALSGFVAGNTNYPVLACPPHKDKIDMLVNIHSTLQMPSDVPVMTVLDPKNAALAAKRIIDLSQDS